MRRVLLITVLLAVSIAGLSLLLSLMALSTAEAYPSDQSVVGPANRSLDVTIEPTMTLDLLIQVNYGHNSVEGNYELGHTVWITVTESDGVTVKGQAELQTDSIPWWDGGTGFSTNWSGWMGDQPDMLPGDWVFGQVDTGFTTTLRIGDVNEELDVDADFVSGTLEAPWLAPNPVDVYCEIWEENGPPPILVPAVNPDGGAYKCDFSGIWDIQNRDTASVRYVQPDGNEVINSFSGPWARVNYAHDWLGMDYPIGHTFWLTVTDSLGAFKASAEVETQAGGGWGTSGFQTEEWEWVPNVPDIVPGDYAYFHSDDGYNNTVRVGTISGSLDIDTDSVSGPVFAPWFGSTSLDVECHPWGAPGGTPGKESSATADGTVSFDCSWDPNTEWDIEPGQEVAAMYIEPDGDRVIDVYADPAPEMRVQKWAEGSQQVPPGGPVVFFIEYQNDGDATADPVIITDTLPANTTYITDTSGVQAVIGSGTVTWDLSQVGPGEGGQFELLLENSANPGDTLTNQVDITAPYDRENDQKHAEAEVQVEVGQPDLYVNKNANPNDPMPGETFLYEINYGNEQPVASGPVVLTDTLPPDTSVVDWFSENNYALWSEVSSGNDFVLEAPSIPGNWGDRIYLRLMVDAGVQLETQLTNTVQISTAGDTNLENNYHEYNDVYVRESRWNGSVDKWFIQGMLVEGGEIRYGVHVGNNGNVKTNVWLTDTLPAGTTLEEVQAWNGRETTYPWPDIDGQVATWDLGEMDPGEWLELELELIIDSSLEPGDQLVNCAQVTVDGDDNWSFDNQACLEETVRQFGPNLRISKHDSWERDDVLAYDIRIENLGTELLENVYFTDTYPAQTNFNGDWWVWYGPSIELKDHDAGNRQLTFWAEQFEPGETAEIRFNVELDGGIVGDQGLAFTNAVEAPVPGDIYLQDNSFDVTSYTGPDIYVEKWLSAGEVKVGEIVTFTVEFGNNNQWPWETTTSALITDTLPAEMDFINATIPWNPEQDWTPLSSSGGVLVWEWDYMCPECRWQFELSVQVNNSYELGDTLVNKVEMYSTGDVEYDYENNDFVYTVPVIEYPIFLPIVVK
jgi:uncharacterized repeat protein (TIGR01451 family)